MLTLVGKWVSKLVRKSKHLTFAQTVVERGTAVPVLVTENKIRVVKASQLVQRLGQAHDHAWCKVKGHSLVGSFIQ